MIVLTCFTIKTAAPEGASKGPGELSRITPETLRLLPIQTPIPVDSQGDVLCNVPPRPSWISCRLLEPKAENFVDWDFFVEDAVQRVLLCVQVSLNDPVKHSRDADKILRSVTSGRFEKNVTEILRNPCTAAISATTGEVQTQFATDPWTVRLLFITHSPATEVATAAAKWPHPDVLILSCDGLLLDSSAK